jgi:glycosyltransferase involved in cell wall biosynthesis
MIKTRYCNVTKSFVMLFCALLFMNVLGLEKNRKPFSFDLTIVGYAKFADGLGRIPLVIIDLLKDDLAINWRSTRNIFPKIIELPKRVQKIIKSKKFQSKHMRKSTGRVALLTDVLHSSSRTPANYVPKKSLIKIAYSMLECNSIPPQWVSILNSKFDSVVVPDDWLVRVYKQSGVNIPIFVLPLGIYLEEFFRKKVKMKPQYPFVFGNTSALMSHKNHVLLLESFARAFGNSDRVKLKINARTGQPAEEKLIHQKIKSLNLTNVELSIKSLSWKEYVDFMTELDCYVSFSKGEGYSVIPREALALGLPVILSDNTAHTTLCKTGFVRAVPCPIRETIDATFFSHKNCYFLNCHVKDAAEALLDVYNNYDHYLIKAYEGRAWVQQFFYKSLKKKYLNLIRPAKVRYGPKNEITDTYLMTNSSSLYKKYKQVLMGKSHAHRKKT